MQRKTNKQYLPVGLASKQLNLVSEMIAKKVIDANLFFLFTPCGYPHLAQRPDEKKNEMRGLKI